MSVRRWLVAASLAAACCAGPAPGQTPVKEPRIVAEHRTLDLGRVKQGDKPKCQFVIENRGEADLEISRIQAGCGCTVLQKLADEQRTLAPGAKLELDAMFDTRGRVGKQRKGINVYTNDPYEPNLQLFITCEVVTLIEALVDDQRRTVLSLRSVRPGTDVEKTIDFLPTDPGLTLTVKDVVLRDDSLAYVQEPLSKDDRTGVRFRLKVSPEARLGHRIQSTLQVVGEVGGEEGSADVKINGEVVGDLSFSPAVVKDTAPKLVGGTLRPITVRSENGRSFKVERVVAGPFLEPLITPRRGDKEYVVTLRVRETAEAGPFGTYVDIYTDNRTQPLIRVPLFGHISPRVEIVPPVVVLKGSTAKQSVRLESADGAAFWMGEIGVEPPYAVARPIEPSGRSRDGVRYLELAVSSDAPAGRHDVTVRVKTDVDGCPEVLIPVSLVVQ